MELPPRRKHLPPWPVTEDDHAGYDGFCPVCHQREGPLPSVTYMRYWRCSTHKVHWIGRSLEAIDLTPDHRSRVAAFLRGTSTVHPSQAWRPLEVMAEFRQQLHPADFERHWPRGGTPAIVLWPQAEDEGGYRPC
jgi:hypothetical protein